MPPEIRRLKFTVYLIREDGSLQLESHVSYVCRLGEYQRRSTETLCPALQMGGAKGGGADGQIREGACHGGGQNPAAGPSRPRRPLPLPTNGFAVMGLNV